MYSRYNLQDIIYVLWKDLGNMELELMTIW